jgi:hypothetical protein
MCHCKQDEPPGESWDGTICGPPFDVACVEPAHRRSAMLTSADPGGPTARRPVELESQEDVLIPPPSGEGPCCSRPAHVISVGHRIRKMTTADVDIPPANYRPDPHLVMNCVHPPVRAPQWTFLLVCNPDRPSSPGRRSGRLAPPQ